MTVASIARFSACPGQGPPLKNQKFPDVMGCFGKFVLSKDFFQYLFQIVN